METKNYLQIIKEIQDGKRDKIYYVDINLCNIDADGNENFVSFQECHILDSEEACMKFVLDKESEVQGWCTIDTCYRISIYYVPVFKEDISYFATYNNEDDARDFILQFIIDNEDSADEVDSQLIEYDYKELKGCVLLFWDWYRYIGYARNYEDIRIAYKEDESITIPIDHTYRTQCDVLLTVDDIKNCDTEEELLDAVYEALYSFDKWRNLDADSVAEEVVDEIYSNSWMYDFTLPKRDEKEDD